MADRQGTSPHAGLHSSLEGGDVLIVNPHSPLADDDGGTSSPYVTIQAALNDIGEPQSEADQKRRFTVIIAPGVYDQSLQIAAGRRITLLCEGPVTIGDGAADSDFVSTTPRNITVDCTPAFGGRATLTISPAVSAQLYGARCTQTTAFDISGDLVLVGDPTAALVAAVRLYTVRIRGNLDGTGLTAIGVDMHLKGTRVDGTLNGPNIGIIDAFHCAFQGLVSVLVFVHALACSIEAGLTVVGPPSTAGSDVLPGGMYSCRFSGTFTGPSSSAWMDAATNYWFKTNGASLAGGASKTILGDLTP